MPTMLLWPRFMARIWRASWPLRLVLLLAAACAAAQGQAPPTISVGEFADNVSQMQALAAACEAASSSCDALKVVADTQVGKEGEAGSFAMHWRWLREAMDKAKDSDASHRTEQMRDVTVRLQQMSQELEVDPAHSQSGFQKIRSQADSILAQKEFQRTVQESWWDRLMVRFWSWVVRGLSRIGRISGKAQWLGPLLEWGLFIAAAAGLLFFIFRNVSQQRLRVVMGEGAAARTAWDRESQDWARLADASAAQGDWREAVHELYWAAIVYLEARRAWRHNPSRTPREYVRLLKPGSIQQTALRGLTQTLERVWYGFGETDAAEYVRARALFDSLASGDAAASAASATEAV